MTLRRYLTVFSKEYRVWFHIFCIVCGLYGVWFVSGAGMCYICCCWIGKGWHISTIYILGDTLSGCVIRTPGWAPWGLVLSTPLILFAWVSCIFFHTTVAFQCEKDAGIGLCIITFTFMSSLPCLHIYWIVFPTSFLTFFNVFIVLFLYLFDVN